LGASSAGTYAGHHPSKAKARDFMIQNRAEGNRIASHLWANRKAYNLWYLVWWRRIISQTRPGAGWLPYRRSNPHTNHVHAAFYDRGGVLKPGLTLAYNGTGKNETIRTHEQESALRRGGGDTYNVQGFTAEEVAKAIERERRRREALYPMFV
jgi:hypothetical protein